MKTAVIAFAMATTLFAACNNNAKVNPEVAAVRDSVKLLQYSMQALKDSIRIDSFERAAAVEKERLAVAAAAAQVQQQKAAARTRVVYASNTPRRTYVKGVSESYYYDQPQVQRKKGWSAAAKGAVIGAGAGAVTGILIDKKDARGGIIGAVVGAGTGYAIGRAKDRKTGRVQ
ncbi:glycine zipper 2TM domain-containing protein [Pedobacter sp. SYSU D00535]|uniref:YMGG-like glycine zipper-containing protein n=1 Tax=Pedobacter sp. SYSU D00535 TaxID=2810308 RepID=UPI001F600F50|nr:glycine zipper 2TM domain-containing protein [Pedobacter sp. SYSU D00535]